MTISEAEKDSLPKVTFPARVVEKVLRNRGKRAAKAHQKKRTYKGPVVISCKRAQYNHRQGQPYSRFSPTENLSSGGWKNRKSVGDYFTINAHGISSFQNPAWNEVAESASFSDLGIHPELVEQLTKFKINQPTNVQQKAIPEILSGYNVICAAETGSGKTLAFLLPMLHRILELKKTKFFSETPPNTPHGLILTPSRELADQIHGVTRDLCHEGINIHPHLVTGGRGTQNILKWKPQSAMDVLITTPGICTKLLTNGLVNPSLLQTLVLDEADTLLDDSFSTLVLSLIKRLRISSEKPLNPSAESSSVVGTQVALVSATMPRDLQKILADIVPFDSMKLVQTNHLHRIMPHVSQKFMRLKAGDKLVQLVKHLKKKSNLNYIVFTNQSKTAQFISYYLRENGIDNTLFHANMAQKVREGRFSEFQSNEPNSSNVLVCTDVASRGLDTIHAHHVINFDFPNFVSDYIHRVGRVGRVASTQSGFALSFVSAKWEVECLWKIEVHTGGLRPLAVSYSRP
ncbi:hypothetical protein CAPTEDRAFT_112901 [Capitella teleta]|uniref:RNA helicase n=1 Tax=Capitella teleta TaxID=283909 RepID=R7V329_CAPTE|nr:hypothetical protein CAPTEDRAFT_112901 [Capitella teleta]|eukprot:ELU12902.1 hypothetical protein CAPTEDRAFT_112901 [Capitella teleta]